jgi:hypothetical protein
MHEWTKDEVAILKAAWATPEGRAAISVIVESLCQIDGDPFDDNPLRMARLVGRRSVAVDLSRAIKHPVEKLVREPDEPRSTRTLTATERAEQHAAGTGAKRR